MRGVRIGFLALVVSGAVAVAGWSGSKVTAALATTSAAHRSMVYPVWSPNGAKIAWTEFSGQAKGQIWLASSDGSNAHLVVRRIDALGQLAWLPGNQLMYDANFRLFRLPLKTLRPVLFSSGGDSFTTNRAGTFSAWGSPGCPLCGGPIIVESIAGSLRTRIGGSKVQNTSPTLSPDGRRVAFDRTFWGKAGGEYDQPAGIWVSSTDGGPLKQLTRSGGCPNWSPDGRRLVYTDGSNLQLATGHGSLRLVSPSGGSSVLLLRGNATCNSHPTWSPDSRSVAFLNDTSGQLLVVRVATQRAKTLTGTAIGAVTAFAWSPNSTTLLVTARSKTTACTLWAVKASGSAKRLRRTC